MLTIPVYLAIMSSIKSPTDRISFSQIINDIVEENPDMSKDEDSFNRDGKDIPKDHVLNIWLERLKANGWWMPWMNETTEVTFYTGEYREGDSTEAPAVQ
jgi:hypothetical protein